MWIFTPQESKAILFILVVLSAGAGVLNYRNHNPDFAPELLLKENRHIEKKVFEPPKSSVPPENLDSNKSGKKINLNTATLEELESLPGIGKELGKRILSYRGSKGRFLSTDELKNVRGIGQKTFEKLRDLISIE